MASPVRYLLSSMAIALCVQSAAMAERPHWTFALKGGLFYPEEDDWDKFYGNDHTPVFAVEGAYMLTRYFEIGAGAGYIEDSGEGLLEQNGTTGGDVDIYLYPVNAYLKLRGVFREEQVLVPYVGGGYTHVFYEQEIENQGNVKGDAGGYHLKAGLELFLNVFDPRTAAVGRREAGLKNTYLFLEGEYSKVEDDDADLGGKAWYLGVRLDF